MESKILELSLPINSILVSLRKLYRGVKLIPAMKLSFFFSLKKLSFLGNFVANFTALKKHGGNIFLGLTLTPIITYED